jgi:hypothetical protein
MIKMRQTALNSEDASVKIDPLSEELTLEEDALVAEKPSLKTLPPPEPDAIPDEILKLREEIDSGDESKVKMRQMKRM